MNLLLDTHIWIWAADQPQKLNRAVYRELQKPSNELYLSPISIWEAHLLARNRRIRVRKSVSQWIAEVFAAVPIQEAPFSFEVAAAAAGITLPESDLGDVLLAATASVLNLTLVTADAQLLACSWLKTLAND